MTFKLPLGIASFPAPQTGGKGAEKENNALIVCPTAPHKGRITNVNKNTMGHIKTFESELRARLSQERAVLSEECITWLKNQVLESYRNGVARQGETGKEST